MSNTLKIPESLQFYFENEQQTSAIEQIIGSDKLPIGLTFEEVEQYHIAKISALTTQLDYWRFMKELWEATWGKALINSGYKEVDPDFYQDEYSMDYVWNNNFYKAYEYKGNTLTFSSYDSSENNGICLAFYVEAPDGGYEISNNLELSEGWDKAVDDERDTLKGLELKGKTEIAIEPLIKLTEEAVSKLNNAL